MTESQVRALFNQIADGEAGPSRVDTQLALRRGRARLRWRRACVAGAPVLAAATAAAVALAVAAGPARPAAGRAGEPPALLTRRHAARCWLASRPQTPGKRTDRMFGAVLTALRQTGSCAHRRILSGGYGRDRPQSVTCRVGRVGHAATPERRFTGADRFGRQCAAGASFCIARCL